MGAKKPRRSLPHAPCANCPFLKEGGVPLRAERIRQIADSVLVQQHRFQCHKTVKYHEDDEELVQAHGGVGTDCAGARIFLEKHGGVNQMMRIEERLGFYVKPRAMKHAARIWDSVDDWLQSAIDPPEKGTGEPCSVTDANCEAPAGYDTGGGIVDGTATAQHWCFHCGEPVCSECSIEMVEMVKGKKKTIRVCNYCRDDGEETDDDEADDRWKET